MKEDSRLQIGLRKWRSTAVQKEGRTGVSGIGPRRFMKYGLRDRFN